CILNDLSPAACHIAYNYNTPLNLETLRAEVERINTTAKGEFDRLYRAEHYEPAVGPYALTNPEVAVRLKNPPTSHALHALLGTEERTWELITKEDVENRLGYPTTDLRNDEDGNHVDVANIAHWICIPATVQYTIWSDVYRCEGFVTIEEPT